MRWIIRHAVFGLCLTVGTSAWYILAQKNQGNPLPDPVSEKTTGTQLATKLYEEGFKVSDTQFEFGPVVPMSGYANSKTVILREYPTGNAEIVARLQMGDHEQAEILEATRDFVRVRFAPNGSEREEAEGWTTWGSVVAALNALVLDTETGELISRIPLSEDMTTTTFSPDGSRAIFSGSGKHAYEIRTSDYTLTRSVLIPNDGYLRTLFYGPSDGALYATLLSGGGKNEEVHFARISEDGSGSIPLENDLGRTGIGAVSPDGLLGFRIRAESDVREEQMIDVFDLATFKLRNTFNLSNANLHFGTDGFILSRDGSELFVRPSENYAAIRVINTTTGQVVRELPDFSTEGSSYFSQQDLIGDSLLTRFWETSDEEMSTQSKKFWIARGRRTPAEPGIEFAVVAASKRYAVNETGTILFGLDDDNRIQMRRAIDRPERRSGGGVGNDLIVLGLTASPDGKRLILFVGFAHGC